ncbi:AMP-binding protein [Aromatoleum petrolei]|uniref:AMP-binding protein n=1 Tax=Aromatoleum petrolei TaxID=76116 RepID=UPI00145C47C9|nr:AMP-binding protein [Aromatoleum petrolei]QTQ38816.1 AMP-dependent synthetase/ligase domain-containing protein [Aromatoleum petrolei]
MTHPGPATLALLARTQPDAVVAWRHDGPVTVERFLGDVQRLASSLPAGGHVLNVCADRYRFTVGLAATLVCGKISLLPSTHTPETVRQLQVFAPDAFCLTDSPACDIDLPQHHFSESPVATTPPEGRTVPMIDVDQIVAYVFTSGSTGTPMPHPKTWGPLVRNIAAEADRLGLVGKAFTLIGTVPPQHMYGFESTVLLALLSGGAIWSGRPFYPADIAGALDAVPRPRVLVSTPFHLRTLLSAGTEVPPADLVVSATAPLSGNLAVALEAQLQCPLIEIYGCTETGQTATRRTAETAEWQLMRGLTLTVENGKVWAHGGHVETPTVLSDIIEPTADDRFLLHGRSADLVNIAGKRSSLGYLNHQLNAIPGVVDGSFFMSEEEQTDGVTRLTAVVVAPGLDRATLLQALRERIDPLFLPRPLIFADTLPRNATGKLPRAALEELRRTLGGSE